MKLIQLSLALVLVMSVHEAHATDVIPPKLPTSSFELKPPYAPLSGFMLRPWAAALSLGAGAFWLNDDVSTREQVGTGYGGLFYLRVAFLYLLFVDAGFTPGGASDKAPFTERACDSFDGSDCENLKSSVGGTTLSTKVGLISRLFVPIDDMVFQAAFLGGIGHRGVYLTRGIDACSDCSEEDLAIDGGTFLSPELDISYASNENGASRVGGAFGLKFEYERYLNGDLASAFWISAFAEIM